MSDPTLKSPERAFTLQKYLILHSQHDALQKHLNSIASTTTSSSSSPDSSPRQLHHTHHHRSSSISPIHELSSAPIQSTAAPARPNLPKRRSSLPSTLAIPQINNQETEILEDEQKLLNVNQQIKTTLTELLNCESVRGDRRYRMWVQSRLMDAEKELKMGKAASVGRRKSVDFAV